VQGGLTVRGHGEGVAFRHHRNVKGVALHLVEGDLYGGALIEQVLQLKEHQRQAVHKDDKVWNALVLAHINKLLDYPEVIIFQGVIVNGVEVAELGLALLVFPGFTEAFAELEVEGVVALGQVCAFDEEELLLQFGQRFAWYRRVAY
jgi:hypothetical protein